MTAAEHLAHLVTQLNIKAIPQATRNHFDESSSKIGHTLTLLAVGVNHTRLMTSDIMSVKPHRGIRGPKSNSF